MDNGCPCSCCVCVPICLGKTDWQAVKHCEPLEAWISCGPHIFEIVHSRPVFFLNKSVIVTVDKKDRRKISIDGSNWNIKLTLTLGYQYTKDFKRFYHKANFGGNIYGDWNKFNERFKES